MYTCKYNGYNIIYINIDQNLKILSDYYISLLVITYL